MGIFFKRKKDNFTKILSSPSGRITGHFYLKNGRLSYDLDFHGQKLVKESALGLKIAKSANVFELFTLVRARESEHDETWQTVVGEEAEIRNHYKEYTFYLTENSKAGRLLTLRFRVFDDCLAFRYEIPPQPSLERLSIIDELTEFAVDYNASAFSIPAFQPDRYEYDYSKRYLHELTEPRHTPFTIKDKSGDFLCIHEAALYDYGEMTVKFDGRTLRSAITPLSDGAKAHVELPWSSPWREIMVGENELELTVNHSTLNLNDPPRADFSWIKPLKFLGIWWAMYVGEWTWAPGERHGATTEHAKEYIDACARLGIPGLLVEGWNNGWEGNWLENGPNNDFTTPEKDFDADYVSAYATKKGVELIGHHETVGFIDNYEQQLEKAYAYCAEHGIRYIKSGYAGSMININSRREWHHGQLGVRHYQKALELAAKYHICLDVHEGAKGTGIERTWPNLLTRECARGQEYEGGALHPSHACYLPFTRLLAGGMDYTSGIMDITNQNKRCATTLARQLAYYVTIFSGMQMAADRPHFYEEVQPEAAKFIRQVPVSWSKTVPLLGEIGEYYIVARKGRDSENWYLGAVTNEQGRRVRLALDFLTPGTKYHARIYRDADDAHFRDNQLAMVVEEKTLGNSDYLDLYLAPGGGFAISLDFLGNL